MILSHFFILLECYSVVLLLLQSLQHEIDEILAQEQICEALDYARECRNPLS